MYNDVIIVLNVLMNFVCVNCWVHVVDENIGVFLSYASFGFDCVSNCTVIKLVVEGCCFENVCVIFLFKSDDVACIVSCSLKMSDVFAETVVGKELVKIGVVFVFLCKV